MKTNPFNILTEPPGSVYHILQKFLGVLLNMHGSELNMGIAHMNRAQRSYDLVSAVKRGNPDFPHPVQDWDMTFEPRAVSVFLNSPVHLWEREISRDYRPSVYLERDAMVRRLEILVDVYNEDKWLFARPDALALLRARVYDPTESERGTLQISKPLTDAEASDEMYVARSARSMFSTLRSRDVRLHNSYHQGRRAPLYYEAHITIEPIFGTRLLKAQEIAKPFGFRVADLLMQKNRQDAPERSSKDTFMTGHDTWYDNLGLRIKNLVQSLQDHDFQVWRYKVEDTMYDSRTFDTLRLLKRAP